MKKFFKKNKKEEKEKEKEKKEEIKYIEKNKLNINDDKYESNKSIVLFGGESIIVPDNKSSLSKENGNIIILDKNIKKNPSNKNKSSNLKIIKNDELEIFSPKIIFNNEEKNNEEKNILKMSISSGSGNNYNNSLYGRLTPNTTRDNSKRGNNEEYNGINIVSVKKDKTKTTKINTNKTDKDTYDILLNNINDELKTHRNKKPLEFENNSNDISILNTKEDLIKEENIHDTDDEGFINETKDYNNFFKGADIYHNKTMVSQYSQPNICGRLKQIENKKGSNGNY
jgi:hypothetical protein